MVLGVIDIKAHVDESLFHKTPPLVHVVSVAELTTLRSPSLIVALEPAKKGTSISSIPLIPSSPRQKKLLECAGRRSKKTRDALGQKTRGCPSRATNRPPSPKRRSIINCCQPTKAVTFRQSRKGTRAGLLGDFPLLAIGVLSVRMTCPQCWTKSRMGQCLSLYFKCTYLSLGYCKKSQ